MATSEQGQQEKTKVVKVVIGGNFGDEGKGIITDYICSKFKSNEDVLNIRFNGGCQSGHTVVKSDGRRHIFSHFGSGSFNKNNITYLASPFIINPILFGKEYKILKEKGVDPKVYVHKDCIVTFPIDMMINHLVEAHREGEKHGSCGVGIYETVLRNRNYKKLTIGYIKDNLDKVVEMIVDVVHQYTPKRLAELGVTINAEKSELTKNSGVFEHYTEDLKYMLDQIKIVDDSILTNYDNIVFEGGQGLLLDCANEEYYPNLTPSSTGIENVMSILRGMENCDVSICYVTRSYFTRHGAGKFKTECVSTDITKSGLIDKTNQTNEYQGIFRYGYFDLSTLTEAIQRDLRFINRDVKLEIAVTHLDETNGQMVLTDGKKIRLRELCKLLDITTGYVSYGETTTDVKEITTM